MTNFLAKIVAWINEGYPEGVPGPDRVPLFALLKRRLTDDEVKAVATGFVARSEVDDVDIGVLITQITNANADRRTTSSGCGNAWPRTAGRSTIPVRTRRRLNSRPPPRRRPVRRCGLSVLPVVEDVLAGRGSCYRCL